MTGHVQVNGLEPVVGHRGQQSPDGIGFAVIGDMDLHDSDGWGGGF